MVVTISARDEIQENSEESSSGGDAHSSLDEHSDSEDEHPETVDRDQSHTGMQPQEVEHQQQPVEVVREFERGTERVGGQGRPGDDTGQIPRLDSDQGVPPSPDLRSTAQTRQRNRPAWMNSGDYILNACQLSDTNPFRQELLLEDALRRSQKLLSEAVSGMEKIFQSLKFQRR